MTSKYSFSRQVNVASIVQSTRALGPGLRSVLYVRGCSIHCSGCLVPEWWDPNTSNLASPEEIAPRLLANQAVTGVTISGGEPFLQAAALAELVSLLRAQRDLTLIAFTGFTLEHLLAHPPSPGVTDLLDMLDLLVDGPYVASLDNGLGLRGSTNQRFHFLSSQLASYDLAFTTRNVELHIVEGSIIGTGIPGAAVRTALLDNAMDLFLPEDSHVGL